MELQCLSEWKHEGNEHANHCFVLFFFFNSQFPCNSHHKVKQIYATEYAVAVMAESMVFLGCISSSHSWAWRSV